MTNRPDLSPSPAAEKVSFVVAVNAGAGNFCNNRLGMSQRLRAPAGEGTAISRMKPRRPAGKIQFGCGFACHCHCNPIELPLNSSDSGGVRIGDDVPAPTSGFL